MRNYYYSLVELQLTDDPQEYILLRAIRIPWSGGEWILAKGDPVAKQEEAAQAQFSQSLMQIFQAQYAKQSDTLSYLQGKMQPIIDAGGTGYSDSALAAMRTSATDTNARQFTNAQQALQNKIVQMSGGSKLAGTSGADVEAQAQLANAGAQTEAASQNQITLNNENLKQQNYWNAINVLTGTSAQFNPLGYSSSATSGSNSVADLSQAVTASEQSQLMGALGGITGGLATGWASGGFKGVNKL